LKNYTSDKELKSLIESMKEKRNQDTWEPQNEQMLMFLMELQIRRQSDVSMKISCESRDSYISKLHDELQDEKGMLTY
jgi:hypothetical protein